MKKTATPYAELCCITEFTNPGTELLSTTFPAHRRPDVVAAVATAEDRNVEGKRGTVVRSRGWQPSRWTAEDRNGSGQDILDRLRQGCSRATDG